MMQGSACMQVIYNLSIMYILVYHFRGMDTSEDDSRVIPLVTFETKYLRAWVPAPFLFVCYSCLTEVHNENRN